VLRNSIAAPARPPESVEIVAYQHGHYVVGVWRNLTIVYWMAQANGVAVRRLQAITEQVVKDHTSGFSNVHIVREGAGLPDAEARQGFSVMTDRYAHDIACVGVVFMGAGFWASAMQSVITGITMLVPRAFTIRFARHPAELRTWLPAEHNRRTGAEIDAVGLAAAIDEVVRIGSEELEDETSAAG
jgi:hypothetical protein